MIFRCINVELGAGPQRRNAAVGVGVGVGVKQH
jgi:hypothetical protein